MGRHSASYIAAQQAPSTTSTAAGAATYVGRVGALALALGVGAAVAGGTGFAHADGTGDNGSGGGEQAKSSQDSTPAKVGPVASATDGSSDAKTGRPHVFGVPKMLGLGGDAPARTRNTGESDPDSLGGLTTRIPNQLAAVFGNGRTPVATSPTTAQPAPEDTPVRNRTSGHPAIKDQPTSADDPVATFVRNATDDLTTALRGGAQPLAAVSLPTPDPTRQQRLTSSPSAIVVPAATTATTATTAIVTPVQPQAARVQTTPHVANPVALVVSSVLSALGFSPSATAGGSPTAPVPFVLGALQLLSREIERIFAYRPPSTASFTSAEAYANANPSTTVETPRPDDETPTAFGDIGKWMLQSDGQISNYGGQPYNGKQLLEPVNVIIVDPTSKSPEEATQKLNAAMFWAGFPAQPIHSTGFQGKIDDGTYGQQPTGLLAGYSDNLFIFPNDHGRIFGPDAVETDQGYVWSGAFSTETLTIYNFLPAHAYVSSDMARTALALRLILSGQATFVGMVPLDNAYNTATTTTGDHDGYAVVLQLT